MLGPVATINWPEERLTRTRQFWASCLWYWIISFIKHQLSNPGGLIMDMNTLNESYKKKLKEFEVEECKIKNNNKP